MMRMYIRPALEDTQLACDEADHFVSSTTTMLNSIVYTGQLRKCVHDHKQKPRISETALAPVLVFRFKMRKSRTSFVHGFIDRPHLLGYNEYTESQHFHALRSELYDFCNAVNKARLDGLFIETGLSCLNSSLILESKQRWNSLASIGSSV